MLTVFACDCVLLHVFLLQFILMNLNVPTMRDVAEELYEGAIGFDWSLIFCTTKVPLQFAYAEREIKVNTQFATLRVKDGVVDSFMEAVGRRPSIDTTTGNYIICTFAGKTEHTY